MYTGTLTMLVMGTMLTKSYCTSASTTSSSTTAICNNTCTVMDTLQHFTTIKFIISYRESFHLIYSTDLYTVSKRTITKTKDCTAGTPVHQIAVCVYWKSNLTQSNLPSLSSAPCCSGLFDYHNLWVCNVHHWMKRTGSISIPWDNENKLLFHRPQLSWPLRSYFCFVKKEVREGVLCKIHTERKAQSKITKCGHCVVSKV